MGSYYTQRVVAEAVLATEKSVLSQEFLVAQDVFLYFKPERAVTVSKNSIYLNAMILFVVVYGLFSSSTPDSIGASEVLIALLLVVLVGFRQAFTTVFMGNFSSPRGAYSHLVPGYIYAIFLYFMIVPTFTGLIVSGNHLNDWVRDFIPLLYFFLPVLLLHRVRDPKAWTKWLVVALCFIGISFSIRHFVEGGSSFKDVGHGVVFGTKAYFTQDPAVPFAGAFLTCYGIWLLVQHRFLMAFAHLGLAVFPWLAILGTALRAPLGLILMAVGVVMIVAVWKSKKPLFSGVVLSLFVLVVVAASFTKVMPAVTGAFDLMIQKHERVGQSGRLEEFSAAIENATTIPKVFFGEGWGGTMPNPTGNGADFRFTHNVVSYFILKSGVFGTILLFLYLTWIVKYYFRNIVIRDAYQSSILLSIGVVLLIHLVLEPGYKMMPLGLVFILVISQSIAKDRATNIRRVIII